MTQKSPKLHLTMDLWEEEQKLSLKEETLCHGLLDSRMILIRIIIIKMILSVNGVSLVPQQQWF